MLQLEFSKPRLLAHAATLSGVGRVEVPLSDLDEVDAWVTLARMAAGTGVWCLSSILIYYYPTTLPLASTP